MADPKRSTSTTRSLAAGYKPPAGVYDEFVDAEGKVRPHWQPLIAAIEAGGPAETERRFAIADQHLREAGVYYRVYDKEQAERPWPLAHLPMVIAADEWAALSDGLVQRAELLEAIVADIYGEAKIVSSGHLPPELLARNPEYLRPLVGMNDGRRPFLDFIAVDLGRGPDGRWWVLGDRTQAPSGAGFALENRVAVSRALPEPYRAMNVERLAGFFQDFREGLGALTVEQSARIGLMTPGPLNETYFEHAYLARYLGFLLLEGGDLVVRNGQAMVRTVGGLKPISVLWRRLDADYVDPLELNAFSRIGTPGLVEAVRSGNLTIANALGSGILETPALAAFLPQLSRHLRGEELALPSVATWWCGGATERAFVLDNLDRLVVSAAMPKTGRGNTLEDEAPEAPERRAGLREAIAARGTDYVGQEMVRISTTPVYVDGRLMPRPATLRAFLARTPQGWKVMPGGFGRVSDSGDTRAIAMQRGGRSADVWVLAHDEVKPVTLLPAESDRFIRRLPGSLPSRAADSLFWLGRYVERAEQVTRLVRAHTARRVDTGPDMAEVARILTELLEPFGVEVDDGNVPAGLQAIIDSAFNAASRIRDRFSPDGWTALRLLREMMAEQDGKPRDDNVAINMMGLSLRLLASFSGLVQENMYQFSGWRFLEAGRRLERGLGTARVAAQLGAADAPAGAYDALLEFADSMMTHRRRYSVHLSRSAVIDLTVLDPLNPRSVAYQVESLARQIAAMPDRREGEPLPPVERAMKLLQTTIAVAEPGKIDEDFLSRIAGDLMTVSDLITRHYFLGAPATDDLESDLA